MQSVLIEVQYLPPVSYFTALSASASVTLERHENYVKQTYRNRCQIVTSQGKQDLTIPLTGKHGKVLITDVRIDHGQKWLNNHWRTLQSAYGKAPFFEHYADDLEKVLFRKTTFLYDLNREMLSMCLKWLKMNVTIQETSSYEKDTENAILDLRSAITPKNQANLGDFFKAVTYHQVFGNTFVGNVSIVDLIFCEGPGAANVLRASSTTEKMNK